LLHCFMRSRYLSNDSKIRVLFAEALDWQSKSSYDYLRRVTFTLFSMLVKKNAHSDQTFRNASIIAQIQESMALIYRFQLSYRHAIYERPIANTLQKNQNKIGRKKLCPCGSGFKFKKVLRSGGGSIALTRKIYKHRLSNVTQNRCSRIR
jgi:hypothetical protein